MRRSSQHSAFLFLEGFTLALIDVFEFAETFGFEAFDFTFGISFFQEYTGSLILRGDAAIARDAEVGEDGRGRAVGGFGQQRATVCTSSRWLRIQSIEASCTLDSNSYVAFIIIYV